MRMRLISTNCRATSAAGWAGIQGGGRVLQQAAINVEVCNYSGHETEAQGPAARPCSNGGGPEPLRSGTHARTLAAARHDGRRQHHHCDPAATSSRRERSTIHRRCGKAGRAGRVRGCGGGG